MLDLSVVRYSRGYKNRAIVKKFFGTLPIFYSCLECQHFVLIMFLTQGKARIACCEHFFANQPRWAAVDGHDVTPISSYLKLLQNT
jgi:hypothetical protein